MVSPTGVLRVMARSLDLTGDRAHATAMTRRPLLGVAAVIAVIVTAALALSFTIASPGAPAATGTPGASATGGASEAAATPTASPRPRPRPGHEVFGFLPYWEMNDGIEDHVAHTDLTTLALFSVTNARDGSIDTSQTGYKRITGPVGTRLIADAHHRGTAVQLVFSSFGTARNARLFDSIELQDAVIDALVGMAGDIGVDGINVDVEQIGDEYIPAYGAFVMRLGTALRQAVPGATVSVATTAGRTGAAMAWAASGAGADRVFLMGYDYHSAGSDPGASAPMDRRDGADADLVWSLDLYEALGVPLEKTILGLPLYGIRWRVAGPWLGAPSEGNGAIWVPADNPNFLKDPPMPPELDPIEMVEFYAVPPPDGATAEPTPSDTGDAGVHSGWQAIYVDSPATLEPKLRLADDRGLAGAGFWAIGYERGLPDYTALIARFAAGKLD
jgi:hypothetical protein